MRIWANLCVPAFLFLASGCTNVPDFGDGPLPAPKLKNIVNHINCELASIVVARAGLDPRKNPGYYLLPENPKIQKLIEADPSRLPALLDKLIKYHFVASVFLTLDVADTEGAYPSATFIHPFTTTFNRALGIQGNLNGSQERNITFSYSVDLANIESACQYQADYSSSTGLSGDLGLADIIVDGMNGLDSAASVNVYPSGGPTMPAFDARIESDVGAVCAPLPPQAPGPNPATGTDCNQHKFKLTLSGNANFAPSSDPQLPGSVSFSGTARQWKNVDNKKPYTQYLVSLNGSTFDPHLKKKNMVLPEGCKGTNPLKFTLSGTLTRLGNQVAEVDIGYDPNLSLSGIVLDASPASQVTSTIKKNFCELTGLLTPSQEAGKNPYLIGDVGEPSISTELSSPQATNSSSQGAVPATSAGGSSTAKAGNSASAAASTQFGSLINFMLSYGIGGGPTWTLSTFKGPGGGAGPSGLLLGASRTHTDSASITFVAACQDNTPESYSTFWDTIPKCNANGANPTQFLSAAASAGAAYNILLQTSRGGL